MKTKIKESVEYIEEVSADTHAENNYVKITISMANMTADIKKEILLGMHIL